MILPENCYAPRGRKINMVVIHCFALSCEEMIETLKKYGLGVHYMIDEKGKVLSLVPEEMKTYHAGGGRWRSFDDINDRSIGIELQHFDFGQTEYPKAQIDALTKLLLDIKKRYKISNRNIVGHSDTSPLIKPDPGRCFPWKALARQGLGFSFAEADAQMDKKQIKDALKKIGYDTRNLTAAAWAFCRHFVPELVPYDKDLKEREKRIFDYRQSIKNLSDAEKKKAMKNCPIISPDDASILTQKLFLKRLAAISKNI